MKYNHSDLGKSSDGKNSQYTQDEKVGAKDNEIIGNPIVRGLCKVVFSGSGNKLVLGKGVTIRHVTFEFNGNNSRIEIADGAIVKGEFIVAENCFISVGRNTKFNKACRVHAGEAKKITIGDNCLFANPRFRTSDSHSIIDRVTGSRLNPAADIVVGDQVWIAEDVMVYKGVSIGSGSIIGARSVVTKSIPGDSLAVGSPAKVVRKDVTWNEKMI